MGSASPAARVRLATISAPLKPLEEKARVRRPGGWMPRRSSLVITRPFVGSGLFIRGYRAGFLFVVGLLAAVAGFNLWGELRANEQVDALFSEARERDRLIGRIRVDALNLEGA